MALFQIQKGKASTLATKRPNTTEGYCYFTTDDGKFYIDIATATGTANRVILNAGKADTAGAFTSAKSVTLTGDVSGTASSKAGWTIATTLANSGVTAGSYGPSANASPAHGGTFKVPYITFDAKGRATSASTFTITLPSDNNTHYTANLYLGGSTATSNATTAVSNPYLILRENNTNRNTVQLKSGGNITISGVNGVATFTVPTASGTVAGVTIVYPAASCTTFSSDSGTVTPLAVQKGAKMFAITRPASSTTNAITRFSNTTGDVKDSKIIIEDVTNTKDTTKKAQVIAVPAEGDKKVVYGYCTDQTDGTSFIGGVFDASATSYPYSAGLAIGGTSGNLLWKGKRVLTTDDTYSLPAATSTALGGVRIGYTASGKNYPVQLNSSNQMYVNVPWSDTNTNSITKIYAGSSGTTSNSTSAVSNPYLTVVDDSTYRAQVRFVGSGGTSISANGGTITISSSTYTLPTASTTLGGVKTTSTVTSTSGYTACPIIGGVVYYKDTNTHAVSSVNNKTGAVSLTYSDVGAAPSSHTHTWSDISDRASCTINTTGTITGSKVYGAVWNDYAEYRWVLKDEATDKMPEPGRCVVENGNDSMSVSHDRLQPGAKIISDTYGMCMGETEKAKTPIAVCGRVLAYPFERKVAFNVGDPVCSGPNGTVSKMSREEAMMYPERIVGTVVSKPTYKEWGPNKIPVNGRIWIQVK